ncbi:hypothetical protein NMG60_11002860 [Bertholletia excelsa]
MRRICQKTARQLSVAPLSPSLKSNILLLYDLGRLQDAVKLVFSGQIQLDCSLYSNLFQLCCERKAKREGRLLHSHLLINGFQPNAYLDTQLIVFYSKIGDMVSSRKVFDRMRERSVVTWTALLSGYCQNGFLKEALFVFSTMHRLGVKANQFTHGSALRTCTNIMCLDRGEQIHGYIQKSGLVNDLFVQSALVDFHAKCGRMEDACYIFRSMKERDMVSLNAMVGGYAFQGFTDDAFQLFRSMLREGIIPDCFTLASVVRVPNGGSDILKTVQVHGFVVQLGFESNIGLMGSLVDSYAKCGDVGIAGHVYKSMLKRDTVSCTALISGYAREGIKSRDAFALFSEIHQTNMEIDSVVLCAILNICANTAALDVGRQIHALAVKCQPNHDIAMGNALIDMYSKSGEIEDSKQVFSMMKQKNIISWTSMISGYGKHGYGLKAIALYKEMECEGLKPNDITFLTLLFACSHAGLTVEAWECFDNMVTNYKILPRVEHYSCMVDLLARGGHLEDAHNLILNMRIKPNSSIWGAILGACHIHGNMSIGEVAARHLFNMEPEKSVNYVVLASIYAGVSVWDSALKTRELMKERNLRKNPGQSLFHARTKQMVSMLPS